MSLTIDLSTTEDETHSQYTYPESDEELKQRLLRVANSVVTRFSESRDIIGKTEELYAVTHELRLRGYDVSIDVDERTLTVLEE